MLAIHTICENIAAAVAASEAIEAYCLSQFGRPLRVCLGGVGTAEPAEGEIYAEPLAPYVEIFPEGEGEGDLAGETGAESASAGALICIDSSMHQDGWRDGTKPQETGGVYAANFDPRLFGLTKLVRGVMCRDGHGALYRTQRSAYDGTSMYPVCYASVVAEFRAESAWG